MKKLIFLLLFSGLLFSIYPFNISINKTGNISVQEHYNNAQPNFLFVFENTLYFADPGTPAIFSYSIEDNLTKKGSNYASPQALFVVKSNEIYVADADLGIKKQGSDSVIFDRAGAHGISIYNNSLYVSDFRYNRLLILSMKGEIESMYGIEGVWTGQFKKPEDLQIFNDTVYVVNSENLRVDVLTTNFTYLSSFGEGFGGILLGKPTGIYVTEDYFFLSDPEFNQLVIYTKDYYPIFVYNITNPRDAEIMNGTLYISQGIEGTITIANISIKKPEEYVQPLINSMNSSFSKYYGYSQLASTLNISHNSTPASQWNNALFSFEIGNYGNTYYKLNDLNSLNISKLNSDLQSKLNSKLTSLAQNSPAETEILSLINKKDYSSAYDVYLISLQPPPVQTNLTNTTNITSPQNNTPQQNVSPAIDTSNLTARLIEVERISDQYDIQYDFSAIEAAILAVNSSQSSYSYALYILEIAEHNVTESKKMMDTASSKIVLLQGRIKNGWPFADYSKSEIYLESAESFAHSDPGKSMEFAEKGIAAADDAERNLLILASGLVIAIILGALLFGSVVVLAIRKIILKKKWQNYKKGK
ncbi:hypothetical protein KJ780_03210 [Candidatus Micrarchaeota archaeon]|nr:hypothetical protein [Candidatus Micrarchaeota archaeon]